MWPPVSDTPASGAGPARAIPRLPGVSPTDSSADGAPAGFDLVVLGAGSGGYACALRAAELGLRVAMVERDRVGGTCLHRGCIPTKALLHVAEVADTARDGAELGVRSNFDGVDLGTAVGFADRVVGRLYAGLTGLVDRRGIEVVAGVGRLVGSGAGTPAVEVTAANGTSTPLVAPHVVLATGSAAVSLPGVSVDGERILTSDQALRLTEVPGHAVVLGGGVVGVEFASMWASMGAAVTIVEALDRLLPAEDPASSKALQRAWRPRGIDVRTGARVQEVTTGPDGVTVRVEGDEDPIEGDLVLVAVGRRPVVDGLGLDEAGVVTGRAGVVVDERLATSVPGVWAVGDLVPGLQLAHRGFAHGINVAERIAAVLGGTPEPPPVPADEFVPRVTYSDPEVASVGLTRADANERFGAEAVSAFSYPLGANGRSLVLGTSGQVTLVRVVDGPIVGVHAVGARVGELMGEATLMVGWEAHPEDVAPFVHAHPTQSEALGEAALALAGKPLHVHG